MEPINTGELITLDNNKEYEVIDIIYDSNQKYVYLARQKEDGNLDVLLGKELVENDEVTIESLDDEKEIDRIFTLIAAKHKDEFVE